MATCLFTGETLQINTKPEHAILQALGGRIVSREITSSSFNTRCGEIVDSHFANQFQLIMRILSPLLSNKMRKEQLKLQSADGEKTFFMKNGKVELAQMYSDFEKGTKNKYYVFPISMTEEAHKKIQEEGYDISKRIEFPFIFNDDFLFLGQESISIESHISEIKCFLLAFDAMLQQKKYPEEKRFTRSNDLSEIRNIIKLFIYNKKYNIFKQLNQFYMGIQPEGNNIIDNILKRLNIKIKPFSHVLIVSTHSAYKTILGTWKILGLETHSYKLCTNWSGSAFSMIIINPILGGGNANIYIYDHEIYESLGKITEYKAFFLKPIDEIQTTNKIISYLKYIRMQEYYDVLKFLELNADAFIKDSFRRIVQTAKISSLMEIALIQLHSLFKSSLSKDQIDSTCLPILLKWSDVSVARLDNDIDDLYTDYCKAFTELIKLPLINPGYIFVRNINIESKPIFKNNIQ